MPGLPELIIVLVVILLVFGPKRLPSLGRQLGGGMREFKDSLTKKVDEDEASDEDAEPGAVAPARPELTRAQQADARDPLPDATKAPTGARDESATRPGS
jgi:sec-independent protein translocase protein TatA